MTDQDVLNLIENNSYDYFFYEDKEVTEEKSSELINIDPKFFTLVEKQIEEWMKLPNMFLIIEKPTQVGVTTSTSKVSLRLDKKVILLSPTNKILEETVRKLKKMLPDKTYDLIAKNEIMCSENSFDKVFGWYNKGNCLECMKYNNRSCRYIQITKTIPDFIGLTYHKFITLLTGKDNFGLMEFMRKNYDVIILDEIATTLKFSILFEENRLEQLIEILSKKKMARDSFIALDVMKNIFNGIKVTNAERSIKNEFLMDFDNVRKLGENLIDYIPQSYLKDFRGFLMFLTHDEYLKIDSRKRGIIVESKIPTFIESFLNQIKILVNKNMMREKWDDQGGKEIDVLGTKHKTGKMIMEDRELPKIFITGAVLPDIKEIPETLKVTMPDFNETERQRLIICDKANWDFENKWKQQKGRVKIILTELIKNCTLKERKEKQILVIAINKKIAEDIKKFNFPEVEVHEFFQDSAEITYQQSSLTLGMAHPQRITILVGLPWTPNETLVGRDIFDSVEPGTYRELHFLDNIKNSLGRGKDPKGIERSIGIILGGKKEEVCKAMPDKPEIIETFKQGTIQSIAPIICALWLKILPDKEPIAKYEDIENLPEVAEILNNVMMHHRYQIPLGQFAQNTLRRKQEDMADFLKNNKHLFPERWEVKKTGNKAYRLIT